MAAKETVCSMLEVMVVQRIFALCISIVIAGGIVIISNSCCHRVIPPTVYAAAKNAAR